MPVITTDIAARIVREVAEESRRKTDWNYDHAENAAYTAVAEAMDALAVAFENADKPDPEPYVGASGTRYRDGLIGFAEKTDAPVSFDPRPGYGPTEDLR
mgnify:CR=1 FL=1